MSLFHTKTKDERLDDTVAYIKSKLSPIDSAEVETLVNGLSVMKAKTVSTHLSLGATGMIFDRRNNLQPRRAKRAVMLAAILFINDGVQGKDVEIARVKALPETSETDLLLELKSWFTIVGVSRSMVADTAVQNIDAMPNWNNQNVNRYVAVRTKYSKAHDHTFNCYNAIVFWAFQAGAISKRFLWNKLGDDDGNTFFPVFSKGGWKTEAQYTTTGGTIKCVKDTSNGGEFTIERGLTIYFVNDNKVFGHVAMSLGDGTVISQNAVYGIADRSKIRPGEQAEVTKMEQAVTHIMSIRHLMDIHFFPQNSYKTMMSSNGAFWEAYAKHER